MTQRLLLIFAVFHLAGCANLAYLSQAAQGEATVLKEARPIPEVIADPETPPTVAEKLKTAQEMRRFAVDELKLPDNNSYTRYTDTGRAYVLWNIVSTPALSLKPVESCFPIAGCLAYRGYYDEKEARAWAKARADLGEDVFLYGVPAYSTLGWFGDPLLNTTVRYGELSLGRLIFHELAHQVLYVKGDSAFNEAFATAVELEGIERWLARRNNPRLSEAYRKSEERQAAFMALMGEARGKLQVLYASTQTDAEKRAAKQHIQEETKAAYTALKATWGGYDGYDHWFDPVPNNAHMASLATYRRLVPAFRELICEHGGDFTAYYADVRILAQKNKAARDEALAALEIAANQGRCSKEDKLLRRGPD
ncbi:MAG: aminopeptidase [Burkholderiales bacterium]|nr:aminopeptidase [Burkholderiales bacterium]